MNDRKLKKLFELSRDEAAPVASNHFATRVMAEIHRENKSSPLSFWDQLDHLFPCVAIATALIVGTCILTDFSFSSMTGSTLTADVNEISVQWLFSMNN